ncbi:hypothetical protein ACU684_19560 [Pseudomonas sp. LF135]
MHPKRQHFNLLKPITESAFNGLKGYLDSLFDKSHLEADGLMRPYENLDFHVNCIKEGDSCKASFAVSVSSPAVSDIVLSDRLFDAVVERFRSSPNDIYVIGEPGSGALNLVSKG